MGPFNMDFLGGSHKNKMFSLLGIVKKENIGWGMLRTLFLYDIS
jgi:hypothetical protein